MTYTTGQTSCPCGSENTFTACCGRYLSGDSSAPTAEALMRSRYTAFTLCDADYLLKTWHSDYCPKPDDLRLNSQTRWLGLSIKNTEAGQADDKTGTVEFVARYKNGSGRAERLHELSSFEREQGRWVYTEGIPPKR